MNGTPLGATVRPGELEVPLDGRVGPDGTAGGFSGAIVSSETADGDLGESSGPQHRAYRVDETTGLAGGFVSDSAQGRIVDPTLLTMLGRPPVRSAVTRTIEGG